MKLLPEPVAKKSYYRQLAEELKPSFGSQYAFIGLNASNEELGLKVRVEKLTIVNFSFLKHNQVY